MSNIILGNPNNVEEGSIFPSRYDLIEAGLHRSTVRGIDGNGEDGAAAIVLSGGYEDDYDFGDEILYTGEGGNDPSSGKQVAHQSWNSPGNAGLYLSYKRNYPIRVIRGSKHNSKDSPRSGYKYCGLFRIIEEPTMQIGKSGFKICRFKLRKIGTELQEVATVEVGCILKVRYNDSIEKQFSIGVEDANSQYLNPDSKVAQNFIGKKIGEVVDLGPGYEILEIFKAGSN